MNNPTSDNSMTINTNTSNPTKKTVHIFLEKLIQDKFGVFIDVCHTQFDKKDPGFSAFGKPIRARTAVFAYASKTDAINAKLGIQVMPLSIATAECSVKDNFEKRVGLTKALQRLYRNLAAIDGLERYVEQNKKK